MKPELEWLLALDLNAVNKRRSQRGCPNLEALESVVQGLERMTPALKEHVRTCENCQAVLDSLFESDAADEIETMTSWAQEFTADLRWVRAKRENRLH